MIYWSNNSGIKLGFEEEKTLNQQGSELFEKGMMSLEDGMMAETGRSKERNDLMKDTFSLIKEKGER
jgi:hypothetical protein